jgi:hypothetical protein
LYAIHNTTIGLVNNGCLALELAKKQIKPELSITAEKLYKELTSRGFRARANVDKPARVFVFAGIAK